MKRRMSLHFDARNGALEHPPGQMTPCTRSGHDPAKIPLRHKTQPTYHRSTLVCRTSYSPVLPSLLCAPPTALPLTPLQGTTCPRALAWTGALVRFLPASVLVQVPGGLVRAWKLCVIITYGKRPFGHHERLLQNEEVAVWFGWQLT